MEWMLVGGGKAARVQWQQKRLWVVRTLLHFLDFVDRLLVGVLQWVRRHSDRLRGRLRTYLALTQSELLWAGGPVGDSR